MKLLSDQSKVINNLQKTIDGLNGTISSLNVKIEKMEEFSKCFPLKEVSESVGKVKTSKDVINEVGKEVVAKVSKVVSGEVFKTGGVDINVTTFSKIHHSKTVHENEKEVIKVTKH